MVKAVRPGDNGNIFQALWESFSSLDKFSKLLIVGTLLIVLVTPIAITLHATLYQYAAANSNIGVPTSSNPTGISSKTLTPQTMSNSAAVAITQNYVVDAEIISNLALLNNWRVQNGLARLVPSKALTDDARWMANDMATNNYFSHTDSLGRDPFTRMDQQAYGYNTWRGENIAAGNTASGMESGAYVFNAWKNSPGHNANMLGTNYTTVGIYRAYNPNPTDGFNWYWVQEFGGYLDTQVNYTPVTATTTLTPTSTPTPTLTLAPKPTAALAPKPSGSCAYIVPGSGGKYVKGGYCPTAGGPILYNCSGSGTILSQQACSYGCKINSSTYDTCKPNPCTYKIGSKYVKGGYCPTAGGPILYNCSGSGTILSQQRCSYGCKINSSTYDTCK